jgi:hypothetical protein
LINHSSLLLIPSSQPSPKGEGAVFNISPLGEIRKGVKKHLRIKKRAGKYNNCLLSLEN